MARFFCTLTLLMLLMPGISQAQLRGHGGPVRALAISSDGMHALSGSFDTSAIRWSISRNAAEQVMRFHEGAVNAVAFLKDGRMVSAGADARIAIWKGDQPQPEVTLDGHAAPVASLAVSPDGALLASASWDHTVRLWPLNGGAPRVLEGNSQNVNGVAFSPDGLQVISAGYDTTIRIWPVSGDGSAIVRNLPAPLNAVAVAPDGEIVAGGADGKVYVLSPQGELRDESQASATPIIALAVSSDGALLAAAGIRGSVTVIERKTRTIQTTLIGPGLPVWSVAFFPDNRTLLTGGADRMLRRWSAISGEPIDSVLVGAQADPLSVYTGDRGAEVYRACIACHALTPDEGNKAGPSLAGIFGRKIATLPGYRYSDALTKMDIVWTPDTVAKLFEVGPAAYTPGTKMPEQTIGAADDRKALVDFLERVTAKK
jgi:cytochrome c